MKTLIIYQDEDELNVYIIPTGDIPESIREMHDNWDPDDPQIVVDWINKFTPIYEANAADSSPLAFSTDEILVFGVMR